MTLGSSSAIFAHNISLLGSRVGFASCIGGDPLGKFWAYDVRSVLKSVDVFLPNEREACKLAGTGDVQDALDALSQLVPIVVIKCGPEGAIAKRGKDRFHVASLSVRPIDTIGAGDSFNGGCLHKFILGANLQDCLEYGKAAPGLSPTQV